MNDITKAKTTPTAQLVAHVLRPGDFPATGAVIVQVVRARGGPDRLVAALRRLTPAKVFHNVYEVWFDTLDGHDDRRAARTSGAAALLSKR